MNEVTLFVTVHSQKSHSLFNHFHCK